jgi:O-antigen/teichoic acid export membrane protein
MLMAMGIALPKFIPECIVKDDKRGAAYYFFVSICIIIVISIIVISLMAILQTPLSRLILGADGFEKYIIPTAFYSLSLALTSYVYSYYRAVERYYAYNISQIVAQVITFIPVIFLYFDLVLLLWVWTIAFCLFSLLILINAFFKFKPYLKGFDKSLFKKTGKELLVYCTPRLPGEIILFAFSLVPLVIVGNKFDLSQTGYFSSAISVNAALASLFSFVGIILLPSVSKSLTVNDFTSVKKQILAISIVFVILAICMIGFVFLFPKFVMKFLYSEEYYDAIPLMKIIILAILPNAFYLLFRNPLDAITKFPCNTICLSLSFVIVISLMLLSKNIEQCAWAYVIGYIVLGIASIFAWVICLIIRKRKTQVHTNTEELL